MAINKYMRAALRALSYAEPDIKRNYRLLRTAETAAKAPKLRSLYHTWEHRVLNGGHEVPVRIFCRDRRQTGGCRCCCFSTAADG